MEQFYIEITKMGNFEKNYKNGYVILGSTTLQRRTRAFKHDFSCLFIILEVSHESTSHNFFRLF